MIKLELSYVLWDASSKTLWKHEVHIKSFIFIQLFLNSTIPTAPEGNLRPWSPEEFCLFCLLVQHNTTQHKTQTVTRTHSWNQFLKLSLHWFEVSRGQAASGRWREPLIDPRMRRAAVSQCTIRSSSSSSSGLDAVVLFISLNINFSPQCRALTATRSWTRWTWTRSRWDGSVAVCVWTEFERLCVWTLEEICCSTNLFGWLLGLASAFPG